MRWRWRWWDICIIYIWVGVVVVEESAGKTHHTHRILPLQQNKRQFVAKSPRPTLTCAQHNGYDEFCLAPMMASIFQEYCPSTLSLRACSTQGIKIVEEILLWKSLTLRSDNNTQRVNTIGVRDAREDINHKQTLRTTTHTLVPQLSSIYTSSELWILFCSCVCHLYSFLFDAY